MEVKENQVRVIHATAARSRVFPFPMLALPDHSYTINSASAGYPWVKLTQDGFNELAPLNSQRGASVRGLGGYSYITTLC